ncbi:MAG: TonB-dependent receptor [Litorimonas sp.]
MTSIFKPPLAATVSLGLILAAVTTAAAQDETPQPTSEPAVDSLPTAEGAAAPTAAPNLSDDVASPRNGVFPADYFETFAPRTALDMVDRIPGFQIRSGDTGRRGLGQGGANILINGDRLTGKANPFDELDQIVAASVTEIRIVEGATLAIPGLSGQVADIIVDRSGGLKGTWEWNPQFRKRLEPNWLNAEVNLSGETPWLGGMTYSLQLREYGFRSGAVGREELSTPDGTPFERRLENIQNYGNRPGVALNLGWTPKPDHIAHLNTEYSLFNFNREARARRTPLTTLGDDRDTFGTDIEDEWKLEVDTDYEFPVGPGKLKLTGVLDREHSPTRGTFELDDPVTGFEGESRFEQVFEEVELIGRAEYGWSPRAGRDWQVAVETAYNELEVEQAFSSRGPTGPLVGDGVSGFTVAEDRAEATLTHNRPLTARWDLQASIGVEYSKLSQEDGDGMTAEPRTFYRPKGFVSATYKGDDDLRVRLKAEREVGQLNFFDFVSSVDLEDDLGREGNPDLVPAQSWLGSANVEKGFGDGNTLQVEAYGAVISDTVDRIPIGIDGDAVGNIGTAYRYGVDVTSTLKGERWNLPGTELNLEFNWRDSTVDDPVQGFARRLNGDKEIYYFAGYRHDIPTTDWAYGAALERFISARRYRLFSIDRNGVDKPYASVFIEHKDVAGMTLNVNLGNLLGQEEFFERDRFTARRDVGMLQQLERTKYNFGPILRLSLSGSF